jgi:hypothetical protein
LSTRIRDLSGTELSRGGDKCRGTALLLEVLQQTPTLRQLTAYGLRSHACAAFLLLEVLTHVFVVVPCTDALRQRRPLVISPEWGV